EARERSRSSISSPASIPRRAICGGFPRTSSRRSWAVREARRSPRALSPRRGYTARPCGAGCSCSESSPSSARARSRGSSAPLRRIARALGFRQRDGESLDEGSVLRRRARGGGGLRLYRSGGAGEALELLHSSRGLGEAFARERSCPRAACDAFDGLVLQGEGVADED